MGTRIHRISKYKPSIFQGSLRFHSSRPSVSLSIEHPAECVALRILMVSVVGLVLAYGYFVSASVLNIIARKEALSETAALESKVARLERDYYAAAAAVTPSEGARLGLTPVRDTAYVHRPGTLGAAETGANEL